MERRSDSERRRGVTYIDVIVGVAITTVFVVSLAACFSYGASLTRLAKAKSVLFNTAQTELERLRGVPFEQIAPHPVATPDAVGEVYVETIGLGQKRVLVTIRHPQLTQASVRLVSDVYQSGLRQ